jgi:hypothetical protein
LNQVAKAVQPRCALVTPTTGEPIREDTIMLRYNWDETNPRIDWLTKEIEPTINRSLEARILLWDRILAAIERQQAPTARSHR